MVDSPTTRALSLGARWKSVARFATHFKSLGPHQEIPVSRLRARVGGLAACEGTCAGRNVSGVAR